MRFNEKKTISPSKMFEVFKSVGWSKNKKEASKIARAYKNADIFISAWDGKELVGIVRAITDKEYNGVIFGLAIKKEYQRKGIGKEMIKRCINKYPKIKWFIIANKKSKQFYPKVGFKLSKYFLFNKLK